MRPELLGPDMKFIASERFEDVATEEIARLRLKLRATERALHRLYVVLKPWPGARKAMLIFFPEASEEPV